MVSSFLRHTLRKIGQRFPGLRRYSGKLGLGRRLAPASARERIVIDDDVAIELDLGVPYFRYLYFHHDLSSALETVLIRRLLTPSATFVDVGAHIGYFALVAAKYAGQVYAFEPSSKTYSDLLRNLDLNPRLKPKITSYQMALSDQAGSLQLYRSAAQPSLASLQPIGSPDTTTELVAVQTLDQVLQDQAAHFIKIDVEGHEVAVLRGAQATLARNRPLVLCEMFEAFLQRFEHSGQAMLDLFEPLHYTGFIVQESATKNSVQLRPLALPDLSTAEVNNVLFVPLEAADQIHDQLTRAR